MLAHQLLILIWFNRYRYMNVNLLITDNNLPAVTGISSVPSRPDQSNKGIKFSLNTDDKPLQVNNLEKPTTDNVDKKIQKREESLNESPHKLTQSVSQKIKSENSLKTEKETKSKEQIKTSNTIKQPRKQNNLTQSWLANNSIIVEHSNSTALVHSKEKVTTKIVPNSGRQLAQLTQINTNLPIGNSSTITGHVVKSSEIKLLHVTDKGQLGLKTVLPSKSNGENGLKAVSPNTNTLKNSPEGKKQLEKVNNTDKTSVLNKTIAETKPVADKRNTTESASQIPNNSSKNANVSTVKHTAENINPVTIQAKTSQAQPQPAALNPDKPVPTNQTDTKSNTIPNVSNPSSKEDIHTGNDIPENNSVQKLNKAEVQISINQQTSTEKIKDRSISTSNKNANQGSQQIFSHNNSHNIITEQTPSATKPTTAANTPGQNSSRDVSADIGRQIFESLQKSISQQGVDRQITIRLNPPELGKVFIKFQQHDNELTGLMEVSKNQTRFEIEQTLPHVIRNLADSGIHIKRLEVMLSNEQQSGQGTSSNQSLQSGGSQQQYSNNPGTSGNDMDAHEGYEWLANNNNYEDLGELQGTLITDSSINLLM
jgi:flagellar hook-length control protein FliK